MIINCAKLSRVGGETFISLWENIQGEGRAEKDLYFVGLESWEFPSKKDVDALCFNVKTRKVKYFCCHR